MCPCWLGGALPREAQELDETWTLTVNGQTVQANPDGSFKISNIAAPDSSPADFLSDDFLRVVGTRTVDGTTEYVVSPFFQIRQGEVFEIGELQFRGTTPNRFWAAAASVLPDQSRGRSRFDATHAAFGVFRGMGWSRVLGIFATD